MNDLLDYRFAGNSVSDWLIALGLILATMLFVRLVSRYALGRLQRWAAHTNNHFDDVLVRLLQRFVLPALNVIGIYVALTYLDLPAWANKALRIALILICTYLVLRLLTAAIEYLILRVIKTTDDSTVKKQQARGLLIVIRITIWLLGFVFVLDNLGYNVTTIIAGLGIGGIAIALAAQTILGDLFSYFVIFFDRPFEIGDFIIVDDKMGVVEYVGIKTTRLRTLSGEQLVFSNKDLTDSRVHNFKRMEERRVVFTLDVMQHTPADKLELVPGVVRSIIESCDLIRFDRGHFASFGAYSLKFEFVYYVLTADFNQYMDRQQAINLGIVKSFEEHGIRLALPVQVMQMANARAEAPEERPDN
jgi:small-conductance mechanosensitive channel